MHHHDPNTHVVAQCPHLPRFRYKKLKSIRGITDDLSSEVNNTVPEAPSNTVATLTLGVERPPKTQTRTGTKLLTNLTSKQLNAGSDGAGSSLVSKNITAIIHCQHTMMNPLYQRMKAAAISDS